MGLAWKEEHLDFVLIPLALIILFGYNLFHLHRCISLPEATVLGYENHNKRAWVERVLQVEPTERGQAISVISSSLSATTSMASISLALSSLIGAWLGSSYNNDYLTGTIYGNTSATITYIKYVALLSFFLIAFACFVQTARCLIHANFLISMPNCNITVKVVESAVITGSNFWVAGYRALYISTNLLLWIFGPIPMFVSTVVTVLLLHNLDKNSTPLHQYGTPGSFESTKKTAKQMNEESNEPKYSQ